MKKKLLCLMFALAWIFTSYTASSQDWLMLNGQQSSVDTKVDLLRSNAQQVDLEFSFEAYSMKKVTTFRGESYIIDIPNCYTIQEKGAPDLPKITKAIAIPNISGMELKVTADKYIEICDVDIAPSKGAISRNINPNTVPFEYGEVYAKDEFYPGKIAKLSDTYKIRNVDGQNILIYPVQYNPVTQKLRIYTNIKVEMVAKNTVRSMGNPNVVNDEIFENVLSNHFINYTPAKRTALAETTKKMLIVAYSNFMDEMQSFVAWKQSIGYTVSLVNYSTIGSAAALKTYVQNHYNNNGTSYLLLVGDHAQVSSSSTSAGPSDNNYGYTSGNDHYLDMFVGRFSGENDAQIATQVQRTIYYEQNVSASDTWFRNTLGIASSEGGPSTGDDGESDAQHMDNILTDLSGYGYTTHKQYQSGGTVAGIANRVNTGVGFINYIGHGSTTSWAAPAFSSSHVNALTNNNKLPFIISVACVNGNFTGSTCFCEAWMRAKNGNAPTGAIAICGSTINQSWASPMCAQDKMVDLMVANTYKNYGGMFVNGLFQMIQEYNANGIRMADTWTVFGDPSLQMRTPGNTDGPSTDTIPKPPIANFSASANLVAVGGSVNFTNTSSYNPTSYFWTFEGGTPATSTDQNPSVTYNTIGTYDVTLIATNAQGTDTIIKPNHINVQQAIIQYCSSKGNNSSYEWIDYVALSNMANTTASNNGYGDFTTKKANIKRGSNQTIYVSCGFKGSSYNEYWKVWIDWNKDGTFESNELVASGSSSSSGNLSYNFTVPANAALGETRMRVSMKYNSAPTACETFTYGEVEDYTVNVTATREKATVLDINAEPLGNELPMLVNVFPNPANDQISVQLNSGERVGEISIYDMSGKVVKVDQINGSEKTMSISELPKGIYFISIEDERTPLVKRFVKK
ncbi:MAG: C25 family cysteine peptidase [Bacteroidales bacterium]|nr:C25 family cysteine peptidase [Bacteroidales bacterium]